MMNLGMGAMPWQKGYDMRQQMTGAPGVGPMHQVSPMTQQPGGLWQHIKSIFGNQVPQTGGGPEQPGGLLGMLAGRMMGNAPPPPMPMLGLLQNPAAGRQAPMADTYGGLL